MATSDLPVQVHRLGFGRFLAYAWFVGVGVALVDLLRRGVLGEYAGWALALFASAGVAYTFGVRPAVVEEPHGLEVRNPLRTVRVPWASVSGTDATDVLRVHAGERVVRCFAVPFTRPTRGSRMSGGSGAGSITGLSPLPASEEPAGQARGPRVSRGAQVATRVRSLAERYASGEPGPVTQVWAPDGAGTLAVSLVLVLVAVVVR